MDDRTLFRQRLYEEYASTHALQGASVEERDSVRRAYLDRMIERVFPADRDVRIVDLGCGDGALLRALARHGYRDARGVDTSPEQAALAASHGANVARGDLLQTLRATAAESDDVVVAFDVLEHFSKSELLQFGDEVFRTLRPGGLFIVHVPNGSALLGARTFFSDLTHETCFTSASMEQLMAIVGFREVRIEEDVPSVHGVKSATRWVLWHALRQLARCAQVIETGSSSGAIYSQNLLAIARK